MKVQASILRTGNRFGLEYQGRTCGGIVDWVSTNGPMVTIGYIDGDFDGFVDVPHFWLVDVPSD